MFETRFPRAPLRPFIESYWFFAGSGADHGSIEPGDGKLDELIVPDARADIVFPLESPYERVPGGGPGAAQHMRHAAVEGQRRHPLRVRRDGRTGFVWVRLRIGGLAALVRGSVHEYTGEAVRLVDLLGPAALELEERLWTLNGRPDLQAKLLDAFFLPRLSPLERHRQAAQLMQLIERRLGVIAVAELSRACGLSIRTVDRLFQQVIGLPPKFCARAVRFRHVHRWLARRSGVEGADLVAAYGYVDEAHLAKDVASFTGMSPQAYRAFLGQRNATCLDALARFYDETAHRRSRATAPA